MKKIIMLATMLLFCGCDAPVIKTAVATGCQPVIACQTVRHVASRLALPILVDTHGKSSVKQRSQQNQKA